jgi:DHA2 family multidrug resistance protein-like MFS transporter
VFGSIGVAIYRGYLGDNLPNGLPADVTEAATATLGGAIAVAGQLTGEIKTSVVEAARFGFLRGLKLCSVVTGIWTLGLAAFAAISFRGAGVAGGVTANETAA